MNMIDPRRTVLCCFFVALLFTASCRSKQEASPFLPLPTNSGSVSGVVTYQDKEYDSLGFTVTRPSKTIRYAVVEVVDSSSGKVLASGTTGADGSYSLSYDGAGPSVYVRVLAEAEINNASIIRVRNVYGGATYAVGSGSFSSGSSSTKNIYIDLVTHAQSSGAFNILDVLVSGMLFVHGLAGAYPPQVSVFWEYSSPYGTFYCTSGCPPGAGIYILGDDDGDTDGYDDDVILHEYGHFIADKFSKDDSPGGDHAFGWTDEDMRLAWSEGWGNFFPLAVKNWLNTTDPTRLSSTALTSLSLYLDTIFDFAMIAIDFGNITSIVNNNLNCPPLNTAEDCFNYASNEAGVANILWNLMTGLTGNFGMQPIWNVFDQSLPNAAIVNLEAFWDGWISQRSPGANEYDAGYAAELGKLLTIYGDRNIFYQKDPYEDDNISANAKELKEGVANSLTHYLYTASGMEDSDFFFFSAGATTSYTVQTKDLSNGADTDVTVYASPAVNNDNFNNITYVSGVNYDYYVCDAISCSYIYPLNDALTLSSKVTFSAAAGTTYYIEVKPSPNRPITAGRYGTYTIMITSP